MIENGPIFRQNNVKKFECGGVGFLGISTRHSGVQQGSIFGTFLFFALTINYHRLKEMIGLIVVWCWHK